MGYVSNKIYENLKLSGQILCLCQCYKMVGKGKRTKSPSLSGLQNKFQTSLGSKTLSQSKTENGPAIWLVGRERDLLPSLLLKFGP